MEDNIKSLHSYAERVGAGARRWVHYGQKYADAHVTYSDAVTAAPTMHPSFAPALSKVSSTLKDLDEVSRDSLAVTESTVGRLASSHEDEQRRVKEAKRRFADSNEQWAAAVKRAHSVRKETSTLEASSADRDFVDAKLAFECSRFELVAALNEVEASKQLELIESMRARAQPSSSSSLLGTAHPPVHTVSTVLSLSLSLSLSLTTAPPCGCRRVGDGAGPRVRAVVRANARSRRASRQPRACDQ